LFGVHFDRCVIRSGQTRIRIIARYYRRRTSNIKCDALKMTNTMELSYLLRVLHLQLSIRRADILNYYNGDDKRNIRYQQDQYHNRENRPYGTIGLVIVEYLAGEQCKAAREE